MGTSFDVIIGMDVGKSSHHACVLNPKGTVLFDKALNQDQKDLEALFTRFTGTAAARTLLVVDQPRTIGALPVAVAQAAGLSVAYLPGDVMHRAAGLLPGQAKTDRRDARIIAETARTMPASLRAVDPQDPDHDTLTLLAGLDEDLTHEITRSLNRLHAILTEIHPGLERVLSAVLDHHLTLDLLVHYTGPQGLAAAGHTRVLRWARRRARRDPTALIDDIFTALDAQSVTVPGAQAAQTVIPIIAEDLLRFIGERKTIADQIDTLLADNPLAQVLMSVPGLGVKTATAIVLAVPDPGAFASAAHLASYAGIAPVTRRSGSSIRGEHRSHRGNKHLKNALWLSARWACQHDPASIAYYQRKRDQGKSYKAAIMCLARRRCDVIYAIMRDGVFYKAPGSESGEKTTLAA